MKFFPLGIRHGFFYGLAFLLLLFDALFFLVDETVAIVEVLRAQRFEDDVGFDVAVEIDVVSSCCQMVEEEDDVGGFEEVELLRNGFGKTSILCREHFVGYVDALLESSDVSDEPLYGSVFAISIVDVGKDWCVAVDAA